MRIILPLPVKYNERVVRIGLGLLLADSMITTEIDARSRLEAARALPPAHKERDLFEGLR